MKKMKSKKLKKEWISALESGDYKQGISTLRSFDTYCCLGVLDEIVNRKDDPNYVVPICTACLPLATQRKVVNPGKGQSYGFDLGNLPHVTGDMLFADFPDIKNHSSAPGLEDIHQKFNAGKGTLARLNDFGIPFTLIAKIIDKYL